MINVLENTKNRNILQSFIEIFSAVIKYGNFIKLINKKMLIFYSFKITRSQLCIFEQVM